MLSEPSASADVWNIANLNYGDKTLSCGNFNPSADADGSDTKVFISGV